MYRRDYPCAAVYIEEEGKERSVVPARLVAVRSTAAQRWAEVVASLATAPHDVRTLAGWCGMVYVSRTTLIRRCETVGAAPKASLDLGRVARALALCRGTDWRPQDWLDVDPRTLDLLLRRGQAGTPGSGRPSLAALLDGFAHAVAPAARAAVERRLASIIQDVSPA